MLKLYPTKFEEFKILYLKLLELYNNLQLSRKKRLINNAKTIYMAHYINIYSGYNYSLWLP